MKRIYSIGFFIFIIFLVIGFFSFADAQIGSEYCQQPSFLSQAVQPNALFVIDASGSMGWNAYDFGGATYSATTAYEGYFDPTKHYKLDTTTNVWEETTPTGLPCSCSCATWRCRNSNWGGCIWHAYGCARWGCCTSYTCTGDCNVDSGNRLNFDHMRRVDLLRWAITGGTPSSCTGSQTFNNGYCDPELWTSYSSQVGSVCNNNIDIDDTGTTKGGCILLADDGTLIASPWSRVNEALAFKLKELELNPRMGVMFYSGSGVRSNKVYIGDFLGPNSTDVNNPYMNFITYLNSADPNGGTPSGPAMWDALNYFDQTSPQYGGFAVQSGGGDRWKNPIYVCDGGGSNCTVTPCANNFVVLMSDGQWNTPSCTIGSNPSCSLSSSDPVVPAYCMHGGFTNSPTGVSQKISGVYTVGLFLGGTGEQSLKNVAMYGSFNNSVKTWPSNLTGYPDDTCSMDDCGASGDRGSACEPLPASSSDWDSNADSVPDTFFKATNALEIREKMTDVILDILRRATSGTAASILASSEGSGANLVQAIFYPKHVFGTDDEISWSGTLRNFWYYLDPLNTDNSYIREDTVSDSELVMNEDYIVSIYFDTVEQKTKVARWSDDDGSGNPDTAQSTIDIEDVSSLWEGGMKLWSTTPNSRTIWTNCAINSGACIGSTGLMNFTQANFDSVTLRTYIQSSSVDETEAIVRYIRGEDTPFTAGSLTPTYRDRTVTISGTSNVWKLGDIVNSTPKIVSFSASNQYHTLYKDYTYNRYVNTSAYRKRGNVFVGANDGMLHAFKLGLLGQVNDGTTTKAVLCNDADDDGQCDLPGEIDATNLAQLGKEQWAFIPKNAIPYLKYLTDPNYCHLYYVDMPPVVFDASIHLDTTLTGQIAACTNASYTDYWNCVKSVNSWRSILIGGMRMGGSCKGTSYSGSYGVNTPVTDIGYSSYFALDITDPLNPVLLWEFPDPTNTALHHDTVIDTNGNSLLGFSMSGPAIVKIKARELSGGNSVAMGDRNGRWFVVFASGPTGPVDTSAHQFKAFSDQSLKLFVLDLKTGELLEITPGQFYIDTGITNAFGGSLIGSTVDYDLDYQDDALYLGYVQSEVTNPTSTTRWTNGGVIRLLTRENLNGTNLTTTGDTALNPANWVWSYVANNIGPVTASVTKLVSYPSGSNIPTKARLYFGTGRYYYNAGAVIDDATGQRYLFGVNEPCLTKILNIDELSDPVCNSANLSCDGIPGDIATNGTLQCITEAATSTGTNDPDGWYITLDAAGSTLYAERDITDPQAVGYLGTVFFTTFAPSTDVCGFGGSTYVWAVDWDSGGETDLEGKALLQVSTGAIETLDLSSAFVDKGNRRTAAIKGVPPFGSGIALVVPPKPLKNVLDIRKK